jgi:hypothetical protein
MPKKSPREKTNKYANLRQSEIKDSRRFIVLIVEGERTEKLYFQMIESKFFDLVKLEIIEPSETRSAPNHLLKSALNKKIDYERAAAKPDSFWLVSDTDDHSNLQSIIKEAKDEGFKVAISNPCFEVWLFLHLGKILIEKDSVKFCDLSGKELLLAEIGEKVDRKLGKKITNVLGKLRSHLPSSGYAAYENKIEDAIFRAKENLKKVKKDDFLIGTKYIGQTKVGEMICEILDQEI